jgi:single-strand DNA-binding protein
MAVNRRWKNSEGEIKESTDWFNVEAWGRLGEFCQEYLSKGRLVYVEGRLNTDRYEQGSEIRFFTKVIISNMQLLDRKHEEEPVVEADEPITD